MWLKIALLAGLFVVHGIVAQRYIEVKNRHRRPIWIQTQGNRGHAALLNDQIVKLNAGESYTYDITDGGWAGRLWPKTGCDGNGENCEFGQSIPRCPAGGCHPPAETKVEFFFPSNGNPADAYYDISLVDGYSLGAKIIPYNNVSVEIVRVCKSRKKNRLNKNVLCILQGHPLQQYPCVRTDCRVKLDECPDNERSGLGDLRARGRNNNVVGCLAPCKKWNYPAPWGQGQNEQNGDGQMLCCPSPVSPEACRRGIVVQTEFVKLIHRVCRTAYSYSYDDLAGLHNCPSTASFVVSFH